MTACVELAKDWRMDKYLIKLVYHLQPSADLMVYKLFSYGIVSK
jgi:ATP-dependent protease HslVU (ClpYQ), peptidase subunit